MTAAGARLAFGTDTPTAPHPPLPNMFIASTRRSALQPEVPVRRRFRYPSRRSLW
jgi:predicted amidohydrolase YtcJ